MSLMQTSPIDPLQRIMTSFQNFEKKLDKLQGDVDYQGKTLLDLRVMVTNLSAGTIINTDSKIEDNRRLFKKATAIEKTNKSYLEEPKSRRKNAVQPLTLKLNKKSTPTQKAKVSPHTSPFQAHGKKMEINPKGITKHAQRHRKADAQRKACTVRNQKLIEKKRSKQK